MMASERGHGACVALLQDAERAAARESADAVAAALIAEVESRRAADTRLQQAVEAAELDQLRVVLEQCALSASEEALAAARAARDRLKRRQKKKAKAANLVQPELSPAQSTPSGALPADGQQPIELDSVRAAEPPEPVDELAGACAAPPAAAHAETAHGADRCEPIDAPEQFLCPITLQVMSDPVITADGHTYERVAIEAWLQKCNTSPQTGAPLLHRVLTPSIALRQLIDEFRAT
jgi:hypothetical protein